MMLGLLTIHVNGLNGKLSDRSSTLYHEYSILLLVVLGYNDDLAVGHDEVFV